MQTFFLAARGQDSGDSQVDRFLSFRIGSASSGKGWSGGEWSGSPSFSLSV